MGRKITVQVEDEIPGFRGLRTPSYIVIDYCQEYDVDKIVRWMKNNNGVAELMRRKVHKDED